jgi:hypothetical protein
MFIAQEILSMLENDVYSAPARADDYTPAMVTEALFRQFEYGLGI